MRYTGRLSVVLHPPQEIAQQLLAITDALPVSHRLPSLGPHRLLRSDELHLNLVYIGEVSTKELRDVQESVERGSRGIRPFSLTPIEVIGIPLASDHAGPSKQLAVAVEAISPLTELHKRLAMRLARPRKDGKKSRFLPHVTIMRMLAGETFSHLQVPWSSLAGEVSPVAWLVSEVRLVENLEGGADRVLASFALED